MPELEAWADDFDDVSEHQPALDDTRMDLGADVLLMHERIAETEAAAPALPWVPRVPQSLFHTSLAVGLTVMLFMVRGGAASRWSDPSGWAVWLGETI